jgi:hypothetical protein
MLRIQRLPFLRKAAQQPRPSRNGNGGVRCKAHIRRRAEIPKACVLLQRVQIRWSPRLVSFRRNKFARLAFSFGCGHWPPFVTEARIWAVAAPPQRDRPFAIVRSDGVLGARFRLDDGRNCRIIVWTRSVRFPTCSCLQGHELWRSLAFWLQSSRRSDAYPFLTDAGESRPFSPARRVAEKFLAG